MFIRFDTIHKRDQQTDTTWKTKHRVAKTEWYFTSGSVHLLRTHNLAQPAKNERTFWGERAPALAIFARRSTHQTDQGSYAGFPRTRQDPANSSTDNATSWDERVYLISRHQYQ